MDNIPLILPSTVISTNEVQTGGVLDKRNTKLPAKTEGKFIGEMHTISALTDNGDLGEGTTVVKIQGNNSNCLQNEFQ